jgi:hypothetical protein
LQESDGWIIGSKDLANGTALGLTWPIGGTDKGTEPSAARCEQPAVGEFAAGLLPWAVSRGLKTKN